jgi:hypothetical protein
MPYILRFVQHYQADHHDEVLRLEAQFKDIERRDPSFPQGRRYQPFASGEPNHTLIWECEFPSLGDLEAAMLKIEAHPRHTELFAKQSLYFLAMRTEIFKVLEL